LLAATVPKTVPIGRLANDPVVTPRRSFTNLADRPIDVGLGGQGLGVAGRPLQFVADDAQRRPSRANRREALRQQTPQTELSTITAATTLPQKILRLAERLIGLAAQAKPLFRKCSFRKLIAKLTWDD
jgi:hypothetical protein